VTRAPVGRGYHTLTSKRLTSKRLTSKRVWQDHLSCIKADTNINSGYCP